MKFKTALENMLCRFRLDKAEELSIKIHDAEAKGYEISSTEDILWEKLTIKIQDTRRN